MAVPLLVIKFRRSPVSSFSSLCEISCLLVSVCSVLDGSMCLVSFDNALSVCDQNQFYVVMDKNLVK